MKLPRNIQPLIDGDWLVFMACQAIEYKLVKDWKDGGEVGDEPTPSFEKTIDVLHGKLDEVAKVLETSVTPIFYFSGSNNFRKEIAVTKVYKGNRKKEKPFHYLSIIDYIQVNYVCVKDDVIEADDSMAIEQTNWTGNSDTCIVTVDKDLKTVEGWFYSPEGSNFPSFGPFLITKENSYIQPKNPANPGKGIAGVGYKFFYAQLIMGDAVDSIPGLKGRGPKFALDLLEGLDTERSCYEAVRDAYRDEYLCADVRLLEQAYLLHMVRGYDSDGKPVMWKPPEEVE